MIVGDCSLTRIDRIAGDLIERVNRKWRGAIGCREQIGVDAKRVAGVQLAPVLIDAMRPDDLLRRRHRPGARGIRELNHRRAADGLTELAPPYGYDAAAAPDLVFLGRQWQRGVGGSLGHIRQTAGDRIEAEFVTILGICYRRRALEDVETQVQRIAAENVAHTGAAHDDQFQADLVGDALQAGRAHLPRGPDREAVAGDDERLAAVHALAEIGHQVPKGSRLPSFVQRLQAF
jgi:hypothetical protein